MLNRDSQAEVLGKNLQLRQPKPEGNRCVRPFLRCQNLMNRGREFLAGVPLFDRKKRADIHLDRICQNHQFGICHAAKLRLNFRERGAAQIPSLNRAARGKHFLRQFLLIAQLSDLRPDNVLRFGHAPKTELDPKTTRGLNCTNFGAT
jgi:hypothetical protein